jgi:imidazolonepropionase-like amidohydrolase
MRRRIDGHAGRVRLPRRLRMPILLRLIMVLVSVTVSFSIVEGAGSRRKSAASGSLVLTANRVVLPDGTLGAATTVVIRNGRISSAKPMAKKPGEETPTGADTTVLCPGLIDVLSTIGTDGWSTATTRFIDPDASALDAIDPHDPAFREALHAGITAVTVAPAASNLVAGSAASLRTFVADGKLDVLRRDGPFLFGFGPGVWRSDRVPTSRGGAFAELQRLVEEAQQGKGHQRTREALLGRRDTVFACPAAIDLDVVRNALGQRASQFAFVHTSDLIDVAEDLKGQKRPVIVGPYSFATSRRVLLGAAKLADLGVDVAFSGGTSNAAVDSLRTTASLAVRHGMDPAVARRAITLTPAKVAGIEKRVGSIASGKDADLVLFSNDPLRLDSVVLEVYVKGVRVYAAKNQATIAGSDQ